MFKKKKSLGQNFLKSKGVVSHIISASKIKKGDLVLEIGPGQGFLTEDLIEASENVLSIEKDHRLIERLEEKFADQIKKGKLQIVHDDVLNIDLDSKDWTPASAGATPVSYKLIANIPYYITGQIIKKFLTSKRKPTLMTLMVQKEVAERIVAKDGKESLLSLSVKVFGEPKYIKTVKKDKFSPAPKVDSAILLIENIEERYFKRKDQEVLFFEIIRKAFNQKRKQIGKTLKMYELQLKRSKIDLKIRPERVSIEEWVSFVKQVNP
jgi:16S rRNA (adenine1518-N6/adenine1519-N6)-dimethyltransferase